MAPPVMVGLMAVSAAVAAASAIQQGKAQSNAASYNAAVEANNATLARNAATAQATDVQYNAQRLLGTQKASAGAAGVDPNQGSPLDIMTDTAARTTLDALRVKYGGQVQSGNLLAQSSIDRYQAGQYETGGFLQGGSRILNGLSSYASARYGMNAGYPGGAGYGPGDGTGGLY